MENTKRDNKVLVAISVIILGIIFLLLGLVLEFDQGEVLTNVPTPTLEATEATSSAALGVEGQETVVIEAIDGDTIEIAGGQRVRYIGIDTPETVDPRRPVGCYGKEASLENKSLVEGKKVILEKDVSETDKFNRLLRYVYVKDEGKTIFINEYLAREGFAKSSSYPPDIKYQQVFIEAEREARELKKGLWGKC